MADALLGKLRALIAPLQKTIRMMDFPDADLIKLADLLPQIIAQIERQPGGNARYEYLRSMSPRQYSEFHAEWMRSDIRFDDYVDALVAERRTIVANAIKERT